MASARQASSDDGVGGQRQRSANLPVCRVPSAYGAAMDADALTVEDVERMREATRKFDSAFNRWLATQRVRFNARRPGSHPTVSSTGEVDAERENSWQRTSAT